MVSGGIVGIWFQDLPTGENEENLTSTRSENPLDKNPIVWAACTKFVLGSHNFKEVHSPSQD